MKVRCILTFDIMSLVFIKILKKRLGKIRRLKMYATSNISIVLV